MTIALSNSSPLIALGKLNRLDLLAGLCAGVHTTVTPKVATPPKKPPIAETAETAEYT